MPFSCHVAGGKPVLTPSDDKGHRILGAREQRKVRTCSTVDPLRCRQWTTFKFDMDCGGTRVSWMQVFANASEHTRRRVWQNNGRLRVQDTPQRSKRVDDMCARRMGANMEWWSVNEICDAASPLNAPTSTDMPAGFAPMLGLDAAFLPEDALRTPSQRLAEADERAAAEAKRAGEPGKAQQPRSVSAKAKDLPSTTDPAAGAARPDVDQTVPAPQAVAKMPAAGAASVRPVVAVAETSSTPPAPGAKSDTRAVGASRTTTEPDEPAAASPASEPPVTRAEPDLRVQPPVPISPTAGVVVAPTQSAAATVASDPAVVAKTIEVASGTVEPSPPSAAMPSAPQETGSLKDTPPAMIVATDGDASQTAETVNPAQGETLSWAIAAFACAALVMTGLVLNWLYRSPGKEEAQGLTAAVDTTTRIAEALNALPGAQGRGQLVPVNRRDAVALPMASPAKRRSTPAEMDARMDLGDRMPITRPEALAVLGMGVASEGNIASLKKIIDGLRMNWHPDLARDDVDRQTRELRLKQINAAWDILGGQVAEA